MVGARLLKTKKATASPVRFASSCQSASFHSIAALKRRFTRLMKHVSFMRTQKTTTTQIKIEM